MPPPTPQPKPCSTTHACEGAPSPSLTHPVRTKAGDARALSSTRRFKRRATHSCVSQPSPRASPCSAANPRAACRRRGPKRECMWWASGNDGRTSSYATAPLHAQHYPCPPAMWGFQQAHRTSRTSPPASYTRYAGWSWPPAAVVTPTSTAAPSFADTSGGRAQRPSPLPAADGEDGASARASAHARHAPAQLSGTCISLRRHAGQASRLEQEALASCTRERVARVEPTPVATRKQIPGECCPLNLPICLEIYCPGGS
jgi:hypothetical protein